MKRLLASLALVLTLGSFSASAASSDSFDVRNIFEIEGSSTEDGVDGSFNLTEDLINEGEEAGSPAAALLLRVINILTLLIGTFGVIMLIIGGLIWATSNGDESKIDRGKAILGQTLAGLAVAFLSYFIVTFILSFFY